MVVLSVFDSIKAGLTESLGVGNTLSILQFFFSSALVIAIAYYRNKNNNTQVEIVELQESISKLTGAVEQLSVNQQAALQVTDKIGKMVNTAYMNSKLSTEVKTEIAILQGEIEKNVNVIVAEAAGNLEEKVTAYVTEKANLIEDPVIRNQVLVSLGIVGTAVIGFVKEKAEDLVEQVPEFLKEIT